MGNIIEIKGSLENTVEINLFISAIYSGYLTNPV